MSPEDQIAAHIASLPDARRQDILALDALAARHFAGAQRWFLDGRNAEGKVVTNPNIGYGNCALPQSGSAPRPFYRLGLAATSSGISIYIMGLADKTQLARSYGARLGKAKITGYCISFKALKDIDQAVLSEVFHDAAQMT